VGLAEYRRKRRFDRTPEPRGKTASKGRALRFVVQKHDATRLHYDFRLELDGVLKSWAVPKGPSLNPADKRLAVRVEDHPLDYRTFEGTIPAGNYGAGEVIVWDEGTYRPAAAPGAGNGADEIRRGLEAGRLNVLLEGHKLKGEFTLIRTRRKGEEEGKNWLLIKRSDEWATDRDVTADDHSVRSDRRLKDGGARAPRKRGRPPASGSARASMPRHVRPMLATLVDEPFDRENWLFEVKWDGYRAIAEVAPRHVELYSRNQTSFNDAFPTIVESLKRLRHSAVLDGEIVALDEAGRSQFQLLQNFRRSGKGRLVYCVFDLLYLDGRDLRAEPLRTRRRLLAPIVKGLPNVMLSESVAERGIAFFSAAIKHGLEGIVAKAANSPYREGRRGPDWLKIKTHNRQEAVIGGFTEPRRSRKHLGAVVLGMYEDNDLVYIGHTGGGSSEAQLAELRERLEPLVQESCPFRKTPKVNARVHWVSPKLVCEVRFQEWTADGRMRQPILLGLREDKPARSVHRETPKMVHPARPARAASRRTEAPNERVSRSGPEPALTNLDKLYWPDDGYTKGDLIDYYRDIAPIILPYLRDRPMSLHRHPDGINAESFFQKDVSRNPPPPWVQTVPIPSESTGKTGRYVVCQDAATLLYLANLGCIEMNPWNARMGALENPDYLVLDLDPVDLPFVRVVEAAIAVRKVLDRAGIESFCKTSGKRGLHVFVPLGARYTHDEARRFAEVVAQVVHAELPATTSLVRSPSERKRKVYLDYLQNRRGQTVVAPYSVRPKPGAPVSTPLLWREVKKDLDPARFTMKTIRRRVDRLGDLWQPVLGAGIDLAAALDRLAAASVPVVPAAARRQPRR
jgi:bifunctional non-homologous end joining protein LigD